MDSEPQLLCNKCCGCNRDSNGNRQLCVAALPVGVDSPTAMRNCPKDLGLYSLHIDFALA